MICVKNAGVMEIIVEGTGERQMAICPICSGKKDRRSPMCMKCRLKIPKIPTLERFMKFVSKDQSGCWLWTGCLSDKGYGRFGQPHSYSRKITAVIPAHRMAWILLKGEVPDGLFVCHKCDIRACVNPEHLFLGTAKDNMHDMIAKGRAVHPPGRVLLGEANFSSRFKSHQIICIRKLYEAGVHKVNLARMFATRTSYIHAIVTRKNWAHI
jgi:hypothetical protein